MCLLPEATILAEIAVGSKRLVCSHEEGLASYVSLDHRLVDEAAYRNTARRSRHCCECKPGVGTALIHHLGSDAATETCHRTSQRRHLSAGLESSHGLLTSFLLRAAVVDAWSSEASSWTLGSGIRSDRHLR